MKRGPPQGGPRFGAERSYPFLWFAPMDLELGCAPKERGVRGILKGGCGGGAPAPLERPFFGYFFWPRKKSNARPAGQKSAVFSRNGVSKNVKETPYVQTIS